MMGIRPGKETVDMCKAAEEWKEDDRNCLKRVMSRQDAIAISGIE